MKYELTLEVPDKVYGLNIEYSHYGTVKVKEVTLKYYLQNLYIELSKVGVSPIGIKSNMVLLVDTEGRSVGLVSWVSNNQFDTFA